MLKQKHLHCAIALLTLLLTGCHKPDIPANSMYYWNKELKLSSVERNFLTDQHITTVYLHLFDLEPTTNEKVEISNRMAFIDKLSQELNIVPLVFIKPDLISKYSDTKTLAKLIVDESDKALIAHGYPVPKEIQIDCDWGEKENQDEYFKLLKEIRTIMHDRTDGQLSCVVRLYQLKQDTPPVDYVTLMMHNTGSERTRNPMNAVLTYDEIYQYLDDLMRYNKPMATVLPLYGWDMVYQSGNFSFVARGLNLKDTTRFEQIEPDVYRSKIYRAVSPASDPENKSACIYPGDIIHNVKPSAEMLDSVASLISSIRPGDQGNIALMRLDSASLSRFPAKTYKTLLDGGSLIKRDRKVIWD